MDQPFNFKKYSLLVFATSFLLLIFVVVFNLIVDPLDIYRLVKKEDFNKVKPAVAKYTRISKPILTEWYQPKSVVFGSSRVELGINMAHPGWELHGKPAFNNAVIAAPMKDVKRLALHAMSVTELKTMVIGLDFFQFNAHRNTGKGITHEEILAVNSKDEIQPLHKAHQLLITLLSRDVFSSGIRTLKYQNDDDRKFTDTGQRINETHIKRKIIRKGGQRILFQKVLNEFVSATQGSCENSQYEYRLDKLDTMRMFRAILKKVKENNIELKLFISPLHAWSLEAFDRFGYWQKFEQWKRDLVTEVEHFNKVYPAKKIVLWDFNYYNPYTTEAIPAPGDKTTIMQWHIDPGHYRDTLGDIILDTLLLNINHNAGVQLSSENIEAHIKTVRKGKTAFQLQNGELIKKLQKNAPANCN